MESSMKVPLLDLKAQFSTIREEVLKAVTEACEAQGFILGPKVADFEKEVAAYVGSDYSIGVASGSDALLLSLMAAGLGPGDEVITVPFTFFATTGAISRLGAIPVFVDIQRDSFNIDPTQIESNITKRTKAIVPVHLFGQCADMEPIREVASRYGLLVIEDAAQAIGASRAGQKAGTLGDMGCFSFFPSKNLGGFGDGGMVTTNDAQAHEKIKMLRVHGSRTKYVHECIGINSRLDALQAVVLQIKLQHLDRWTEGRRRNATRYERLFEEAKLLDRIVLPQTTPPNYHVFNQFTIRAPNRNALRAHLHAQGIGTEIYYPVPMHLQSCYADLGYQAGAFPMAEQAAQEVLSLPIYAELTNDQLAYIVDVIAGFYQAH